MEAISKMVSSYQAGRQRALPREQGATMLNRAIGWIGYIGFLVAETLEEVFERLLAVRTLQQRFDF